MAIPIIVGAIVVSAAAAAYALYAGSKVKPATQSPHTLDSFSVTQAAEGVAVPAIYGICRIPGNIVYYGNLVTEEIYEESSGSKGGGGSSKQTTGFNYYLDIWQTLGEGKLALVDTYINDDLATVEAAAAYWSNGTSTTVPDATLTKASPLVGISHVYYQKLFIGENTTTVPTIHFVVSRTLETGVDYENMTYGNNPAAIIYDMLYRGGALLIGATAAQINKTTFDEAAAYWNTKGYALNLTFAEQTPIYEAINTVFTQVDGVLYLDSAGKYAIAAFDPDAASVATVDSEDVYDMSVQIAAYRQLPNHFVGTFKDREQDYSERTIAFENAASVRAVGKRIEKSVDLTGFIDITAASARLIEIAKTLSYPVRSMEITLDMKYAHVRPGQIITINYDPLGITDMVVRVESIDFGGVESLEIKLKCSEVVEKMIDGNFAVVGGSENTGITITPSAEPLYYYISKLGANPLNGYAHNLLHLLVRDKQSDISCSLYTYNQATAPSGPSWSATKSNWGAYVGKIETFSEYVELNDTRWTNFETEPMVINDSDGIEIRTVNRQLDLTSIWASLTREETFMTNRFLLVAWYASVHSYQDTPLGLEYIAFQEMTHVDTTTGGGNTYYHYQLTGVVRFVFWSEAYYQGWRYNYSGVKSVSAFGFLLRVNKNILAPAGNLLYSALARPANFWEETESTNGKLGTSFPVQTLNPNTGDLYGFLSTQTPKFWTECRVSVELSGSDIIVTVYPGWLTNEAGCGKGNPDAVTDDDFNYPGTITITLRDETTATDLQTEVLTAPDVDYTFTLPGLNSYSICAVLEYAFALPSGAPYLARTSVFKTVAVPATAGINVDYTYEL